MNITTIWIVFSLSFVTALSGALMPGPLFTYTVARTLQTRRNGFLVGAWVIAGHAALESLIVVGLLLGVAEFLRVPIASRVIGVVGAILLAYMGVGLIREAIRGRGLDLSGSDARAQGQGSAATGSRTGRMSPVLAGALVSLANPYWWIWWVTIGSAFLVRFDISLARWQALAAFFIGHELGDLLWYMSVSTILHFGGRALPKTATAVLLAVCGAAIIGFGAYLGVSPFFVG